MTMLCKKCLDEEEIETEMEIVTADKDMFDSRYGHYTIEQKYHWCPRCEHVEDYEGEEEEKYYEDLAE